MFFPLAREFSQSPRRVVVRSINASRQLAARRGVVTPMSFVRYAQEQ
jgi:hypothetical protein